MNRPLCSVIIPSRNCINYLPTAFASIALQQYCSLEVIVADDGSTDNTTSWCKQLTSLPFELTVVQTDGIGPSGARNRAIEVASSDLLAFLDADDFWWPNKLGRQLTFHRDNPDVGLTFSDYIHVDPDNRTYGTCFEYEPRAWTRRATADYVRLDDPEACLLADNLIGTSTVVAKRSVLESAGGFPGDIHSAEDWDLWLRIAASSAVGFSTAVTMSYLMRPGSATSNRHRRIDAMRLIVDRYRQTQDRSMMAAVRSVDARIAVALAEEARERGAYQDAAIEHLRALAANPSKRVARAAASDLISTGKALLFKSSAGR